MEKTELLLLKEICIKSKTNNATIENCNYAIKIINTEMIKRGLK